MEYYTALRGRGQTVPSPQDALTHHYSREAALYVAGRMKRTGLDVAVYSLTEYRDQHAAIYPDGASGGVS